MAYQCAWRQEKLVMRYCLCGCRTFLIVTWSLFVSLSLVATMSQRLCLCINQQLYSMTKRNSYIVSSLLLSTVEQHLWKEHLLNNRHTHYNHGTTIQTAHYRFALADDTTTTDNDDIVDATLKRTLLWHTYDCCQQQTTISIVKRSSQ